jgi:hypothetical protein
MVSGQGMLHVKLVQRAYELSDAVGATCREDHLPEITALVETLAGAARLSCSVIMIYRRRVCSAGVQRADRVNASPAVGALWGDAPSLHVMSACFAGPQRYYNGLLRRKCQMMLRWWPAWCLRWDSCCCMFPQLAPESAAMPLRPSNVCCRITQHQHRKRAAASLRQALRRCS